MTFGPGKYDDLCTYVRERTGITDAVGGGVCVIVIKEKGSHGFSIQADFETALLLPDILEEVARQMRKDMVG